MDTEPPVHALATFDDRVERHRAELLAFLARRAPREAEELAQETWLRVASAAPDCPDEASFRGFLYTVARRLLIDHYRRRKARVSLVPIEGGREPSGGSDPHAALCAGETLLVVEQALRSMKPEIAEVFRLRTTTGQTFKEIAARQGVPLNTALGRMHQATKRIAAALDEAGIRPRGER